MLPRCCHDVAARLPRGCGKRSDDAEVNSRRGHNEFTKRESDDRWSDSVSLGCLTLMYTFSSLVFPRFAASPLFFQPLLFFSSRLFRVNEWLEMDVYIYLVFYVFAVIATKLFGGEFPQWFGTIGESMYSLFQIMTLESWSMGIVRPVMVQFPYAWSFFVVFIIVSSFTVLNLFIAIIVDSMQTLHSDGEERTVERIGMVVDEDTQKVSDEIARLRAEIRELRSDLGRDRS